MLTEDEQVSQLKREAQISQERDARADQHERWFVSACWCVLLALIGWWVGFSQHEWFLWIMAGFYASYLERRFDWTIKKFEKLEYKMRYMEKALKYTA